MGCDIHLFIERRVDGKWHCCHSLDSSEGDRSEWQLPRCRRPGGRNYYLFGFLTGGEVRCDLGPLNGIFPARGFPRDASPEVASNFNAWCGDAHTPSSLTLAQIKGLNGVKALDYTRNRPSREGLRRTVFEHGFTPAGSQEAYDPTPVDWHSLYVVEDGMVEDKVWAKFQDGVKAGKPDYNFTYCSWTSQGGHTWHSWRVPIAESISPIFGMLRALDASRIRVNAPVEMFNAVANDSERVRDSKGGRPDWRQLFGLNRFWGDLYGDICADAYEDAADKQFDWFRDHDGDYDCRPDYDFTLKDGDADIRMVFYFDN